MSHAVESIAAPSRADFETMLEASLEGRSPQEGSVIRGAIVAIARLILGGTSFDLPHLGLAPCLLVH